MLRLFIRLLHFLMTFWVVVDEVRLYVTVVHYDDTCPLVVIALPVDSFCTAIGCLDYQLSTIGGSEHPFLCYIPVLG